MWNGPHYNAAYKCDPTITAFPCMGNVCNGPNLTGVGPAELYEPGVPGPHVRPDRRHRPCCPPLDQLPVNTSAPAGTGPMSTPARVIVTRPPDGPAAVASSQVLPTGGSVTQDPAAPTRQVAQGSPVEQPVEPGPPARRWRAPVVVRPTSTPDGPGN